MQKQTCELAGVGATMSVLDDLAEWDYGDYEGLRSVEIREQRPGWDIFATAARKGNPQRRSPPASTA